MNKYKCSCGCIWYANEFNSECEDSTDDYTGARNHIVKKTKALFSEDYIIFWESNLENANRYSMSNMPKEILKILNKNIEDHNIIKNIMKDCYHKGIGV